MTTLTDLLTTLDAQGALPRRQVKDIKTAIKHLAVALGHASPEACPVGAALAEEATWATTLETYFAALAAQGRLLSAGNRRNVRYHLRTLFQAAAAHGLLQAPLPTPLLARAKRSDFLRQQYATAPYQTTYHPQGPRRYSLPQTQWPPDIQAGWRAYRAKCAHRLRERTFQSYIEWLASYFGYLAHIVGRPPTWDDVFDAGQLMEFVQWHGKRVGRRVSVWGRQVVILAAAMAKVLAHPHARALADLRNGIKPPDRLHIKRQHIVTLPQLEAVATACLEAGRAPYQSDPRTGFPGAQRACRFQQGVILKLLVRVPLRQRNIREMQLGTHLYKDQAGHWHLHFQGEDLKIGRRGEQINEYTINLSQYAEDWVPVLEEWLREYRPRLPGATTSPLCFLTQRGRPFSKAHLGHEISTAVRMHTGVRFYPHLIRTIWATEYIEEEGDYATAAEMLGDTLGVVIKTYYHLEKHAQQAKAAAFRRKKLAG